MQGRRAIHTTVHDMKKDGAMNSMKSGMRRRASLAVVMRGAIFCAVASAALFSAGSPAMAGPGCSALNGMFSGGISGGNTSGTGFSAGDTITLTITTAAGGDSLGLYNITANTSLLLSDSVPGVRTYVVPAATGDEFAISGSRLDAASVFSWSCTPGGETGGTSDSDRLTDVQTEGTATVAHTSGANISGSVGGAIDNALDEQTAPVAYVSREEFAEYLAHASIGGSVPKPNEPGWGAYRRAYELAYKFALEMYDNLLASGSVLVRSGDSFYVMPLPSSASRFAAERPSDIARRAREAFAALGYAPPDTPASRWSTWVDVRGTGLDRSGPTARNGAQINAVAGLSYKVAPNAVIGLFGGYETFDYDFTALTGTLRGHGGTAGAYAGWQIAPWLRWKGMAGWTGLDYDATAGTAAGSFGGSRWLLSTGLTGRYSFSAYVFEPSADVLALWERQGAYTDTLGARHDARRFSTGRIALGGKISAPYLVDGVTPYLGLYGDWRFGSNDTVPLAGTGHDWSARVTGGLNMRVLGTGSLALGAEYGGIGSNSRAWTGNARLSVPF